MHTNCRGWIFDFNLFRGTQKYVRLGRNIYINGKDRILPEAKFPIKFHMMRLAGNTTRI